MGGRIDMGIDIDTEVTAGFFLRWMSVKKMKDILEGLDDNYFLYPSRVGNLAVLQNDEMIGYIDFNSETFESTIGDGEGQNDKR